MLAHGKEPSGTRAPLEPATLVMQNGGQRQPENNQRWGRDYFTKLFWCSPQKKMKNKQTKKNSVDVLLENVPWMLKSTEILRILHFHLMQQAQMTTFQEKCGLDCSFLMQASACSDCRSAAGSCASIGSLCSQTKLVRAYCLWQTFCIFQPVLAFVKSEKCGRKTTFVSVVEKNPWHPH